MVSSSARGTAGLDQGNVVSVCRRALTVCHILRYRGLARHRIGKAPIMCYHWTHDMKLTGLHLLLTLQCTLECDHCFVWGSPKQTAAMTWPDIQRILREAVDAGGIQWIHFEGGEPFLHPDLLLAGVREASRLGFQAGIVTNCFWATDLEAARNTLRPFAGIAQPIYPLA